MEPVNTNPPPAPPPISVSTIEESVPRKIGRILFAVCLALVLAYYTGYWSTFFIFVPGDWFGLLKFAITVGVILISFVIYFIKLNLLIKNRSKAIYILTIVAVLAMLHVYYAYGGNEKMYPAHIVVNKQIVGSTIGFDITPDNSSDTFRKNFKIPVFLHIPDGTVVETVASIEQLAPVCEQPNILGYQPCKVSTQNFTFDFYTLTQPGQYTIDSTDKNITGTTFEVQPSWTKAP